MESEVPLCLIENVKGQLRVNQKALEVLSAITQPIVVVAIVGLYRTGKSYLMNKLAGKRTEGDNQNDCWIFALAILLSSTFVYNSMGVINQLAMDQLHYVTKLTDQIRARSSPKLHDGVEDSAEFVSFFPDFVWTLRDVTLRLEADGRSLTADEYLDYSLKLKEVTGTHDWRTQRSMSEEDKKYNLLRLCIRKFFPKKKCFVFYPPAEWKKLCNLESLHEDELDSDFVRQASDFCSFIFSFSKAKTLPGGIKVNGTRPWPSLQTQQLCRRQLTTTVSRWPSEWGSPQTRSRSCWMCTQPVRRKPLLSSWSTPSRMTSWSSRSSFCVTIEKKKETFMGQNEATSLSHCQVELDKLSESLRENPLHGVFSVPGGHSLYLEARKKIQKDCEQVPRKGMKASEVFQNFLKSQITVEESILQSDKALTESQKTLAAELAKKEAAEKELELMRQQQKETEEKMEALKRSVSETMAQMQEKILMERENHLSDLERVLDLKMKALEKLTHEGLEKQCDDLKKEIKRREKEIRTMKENSTSRCLDGTLDFFHELLLNVLSSEIKRTLREI
ncbi:Guanylate-binding protein 4 [Apodemus speciosus]|uniref:Guanylate-binding protein 4 n=1 Tax=Apodemus speciosus TaxID=105296 RepID=A0ABQ0EMW1_APOSI